MYVCTKSFLKTTTNSLCVCTHLANKADSDSDSDSDLTFLLEIMDAVSSGLKRRETFQRVISVQFKSQHL